MRTDGQVLRDMRDRDQRARGWIMVQDGYGAAVRRIVGDAFTTMQKRVDALAARSTTKDANGNDVHFALDEDLLDLLQELEHHIIECTISILKISDKAEMASRGDARATVVTTQEVVDYVGGIVDTQVSDFWTYVREHGLLDERDPTQNRIVLYLRLVEKELRMRLPELIGAYK